MKRTALFIFNLIVGTLGGTAYGLLLRRSHLEASTIARAFLEFGSTGFFVGLTVAIGATLGPRDPLPPLRCIWAQALVVVVSAIGGALGSLFPQLYASVDKAVRESLAQKGLVVGSWLGAAVGTALEIIHVYRIRHQEAPPS